MYPKHFRESTKSSQRSLKGDAFSFAQIQQNTEEAFVTNAICVHPPDKLKSKHMTKFPSWSPHNTHRYTKKHGKTFHAKCQHTYICTTTTLQKNLFVHLYSPYEINIFLSIFSLRRFFQAKLWKKIKYKVDFVEDFAFFSNSTHPLPSMQLLQNDTQKRKFNGSVEK